jgi:ABC-type multidrug transport system fused ATPase/permease subunit
VFGSSLKDWNLDALKENISWVSQDTYLYPRSIYENIAYGKSNAAEQDVFAAAKAAAIHDFIETLPNGYQTLVGERGAKLSGGQKQRIAIARAILKDAPILLLDEATSALDTESEHEVQMALEELMKGRTTLVVAHRLTTIQSASMILVMENGHIAERGTHEELIQAGNLYRKLYYKQYAVSGDIRMEA